MMTISFLKRPGMNQFLKCMSETFNEIVVFTESPKEYADAVINSLKPLQQFVTHRLYA